METLKEELQNLISKDINDENMEEIQAKQDELGIFKEQKIFDILSKKKNYQLAASLQWNLERPATVK